MDYFTSFGSVYTIFNIYDFFSTKHYLQNNKQLYSKYFIEETEK
jgi:hypothetical protein